jgi:hypothetical protein
MATKRLGTKPTKHLTAEQKVAFGLLMFLGIGGVFFGFQSFGANLARPAQEQIARYYTGEEFLTEDEREARELEESKTKDTDGDGLVDYDELYVYKTSPYIQDSDSDGFTDKEEVFSNNDPNCPVGESCGVILATSDEEIVVDAPANALAVALLGEEQVALMESMEFDSETDITTFFQQATMEQIREALLASGVTQEQLDLVDDETLRAFFDGSLEEAIENGTIEDFLSEEE